MGLEDAPYQADPVSSPYPAVSARPNYTVAIAIEYWNASSGSFVSTVRNDGLQKITVTVTSGSETLQQTSEYKVDR